MVRQFVAFAALAVSVASPLCAQSAAPKPMLSLRQVEANILPRLPGFDYIAPELVNNGAIFRLKFQRGVNTVWIDVDRSTGEIVGKGTGQPPADD